MNPLFPIDLSISDSLKIVRKSILIYATIIEPGILNYFTKNLVNINIFPFVILFNSRILSLNC